MIVRRPQESFAGNVSVPLESFEQGFGSVELRHDVRPGEFVPDVVMPDDLAVRRVEKGDSIPPKVERTIGDALAIPFGLRKDALGAESQFLGFDDADDPAIDA